MEEKFTFFWNGTFSQWTTSPFMENEIEFNCAEQYMMYHKAKFFEDDEIAAKIMNTKSPKEQKALGRQVKGFDKEKWEKVAKKIVYKGNYLKYSQNPEFHIELMETSGTTLVEASPYDTIWGIGLAEDAPEASDRAKWKGKNWLGEILTVLREDFHRGL